MGLLLLTYLDLEIASIYSSIVNLFLTKIHYQRRYIDETFLIFKNSTLIEQFMQRLSQIHDTIKFITQYNGYLVNFLETSVLGPERTLLQPTNFLKLLVNILIFIFPSFYPQHLCHNLPYGQFLGINVMFLQKKGFIDNSKILAQQFINRGFPIGIIRDVINIAENFNRELLL